MNPWWALAIFLVTVGLLWGGLIAAIRGWEAAYEDEAADLRAPSGTRRDCE